MLATTLGGAQLQQGVVGQGSVAIQPGAQPVSAYAAQYQQYQQSVIAVQQQQSATADPTVYQQPQVDPTYTLVVPLVSLSIKRTSYL